MPYTDLYLIPVASADRDKWRDFELSWWPLFRDARATRMTLPPGR